VSLVLFLAPHVLFVNFDGAAIMGGTDCSDATKNCTFLAGNTGTIAYPSFTGSATDRQQILAEINQMFARFNVQIVTTRPPSGTNYEMTMVGGMADLIHQPVDRGGVAVVDCGNLNENDISFVFSASSFLAGQNHAIAVAIAQESAHGYGLAHTDQRTDVMFPYISVEATGFLDQTSNVYDLGNGANSDCNGTGKQNSFRQLMFNVGHSGGPDTTPPTISIVMPHDGDTVASGFTVVFDANDNVFVADVEYTIDGAQRPAVANPPFRADIASGVLAAGAHRIAATARDLDGNTMSTPSITVNVKAVGQSPGDLGSACSHDGDCNGGGFCAGGMCTHLCGTAALTCASGFHCGTVAGVHECQRDDQGGCSLGGPSARPNGGVIALAVLASLLLRRRRV